MRISVLPGLGAGLVLAVATACGGSSATQAPAASVVAPAGGAPTCAAGVGIQQVLANNLAFTPTTSNVSTGGAVTFTNGDSVAHTVTFDNGPDCGNFVPGATIVVTFSSAGTYSYHCKIHPQMKGTVTVS